MRGKTFLTVVTLLFTLAVMAGCAKVPQEVVDSATAAVEAARAEGADRYLPELFSAAQDSLNAATAEIAAQNSKFALTRNYDRATALLNAALTAANSAKDGVAAKKDEVKAEAENLMTSAQAAVEEVRKLFAKAPKGKEGKEILEQMQTELAGAETAIADAGNAMTSGDFLGARDKVKAASEKVNSLKQELQDAISRKAKLTR